VLAQPTAEEAAALPPSWLASYDERVDVWGVGVLVSAAAHPSKQRILYIYDIRIHRLVFVGV
jgi:hypothetical protein